MDALEFLQTLVDHQLCYGLKSPDMDLYDFGFGNTIDIINRQKNERESCTHILHVICRFKVIWKNGERRVDIYYEDTPCEKFNCEIERLIGLKVVRVALSDKHDLWLDFGDCWMVFATFENEEESWRIFTPSTDAPHLVASNSWLRFSD